ncbi:MAG: DUF2794 domain-containing protein [Beijerinckiaceae bacterium]|nr:DUF2794 domain-containing protein [Beijerinckiaceae bacterium]
MDQTEQGAGPDDQTLSPGEGRAAKPRPSPERHLRLLASPAEKPAPPAPPQVTFDRLELGLILGVYGRKVAQGEWRDYAIDFGRQTAVFSVFRRTSETPLYRIEKDPRLARKQGAYSVIAAGGLVLKRGHDLARVLSVLDKSFRLVTS